MKQFLHILLINEIELVKLTQSLWERYFYYFDSIWYTCQTSIMMQLHNFNTLNPSPKEKRNQPNTFQNINRELVTSVTVGLY